MQQRQKLLILIDWFDPAYKAGGPIRSVVNMVNHLSAHFDLYVLTGDRDLNESRPFTGIVFNQWTNYHNKAQVMYASPEKLSWSGVKDIITTVNPHIIHLNSMYSKVFTLYPVLMKKRGLIKPRIVISVRGMLKPTALSFKPLKKNIFFTIFKLLGIHREIIFHATDQKEAEEIRHKFGNVKITVADNFPPPLPKINGVLSKKKYQLKILFLGRIHPIKQLHLLLRSLGEVKSNVELSIVGSLEDPGYWKNCEEIISALNSNIVTRYVGELPHDKLPEMISSHHIFALPTKGENFGHAIFEAFSFGKPALISDQTPWRNLSAKNAGWDISLAGDEAEYRQAIEQAAAWDQEEYNNWSNGARKLAEDYVSNANLIDDYKKLYS